MKCPNNYLFYEAEFVGKKTIINPEKQIKEILDRLKLKVWSEKEVYNFMMHCNKNIDEHFEYEEK